MLSTVLPVQTAQSRAVLSSQNAAALPRPAWNPGPGVVVGRHIIADLYGVAPELISRRETVEAILDEVVREARLTEEGRAYKQFEPYGVTGVVLLAESHLAIHTWPEHGLVNLDVFTCGEPEQADEAFRLLLEKFRPQSYRHVIMDRG
ncbi:MAG: S-adenosylmethionine decarboxylase [Chloroflexi bacterium]|nr:S-adenosylmethionine decarboxylase [Chloroflexota bacterium]